MGIIEEGPDRRCNSPTRRRNPQAREAASGAAIKRKEKIMPSRMNCGTRRIAARRKHNAAANNVYVRNGSASGVRCREGLLPAGNKSETTYKKTVRRPARLSTSQSGADKVRARNSRRPDNAAQAKRRAKAVFSVSIEVLHSLETAKGSVWQQGRIQCGKNVCCHRQLIKEKYSTLCCEKE